MPWDWEIHALQCDHISGRVDEFNDATGLINKYDGVVFCNIWQDQVRFIFLCKSCLNENHRILQQHPYYSFNGTRSWFIADDREKFEEKMNDLILERGKQLLIRVHPRVAFSFKFKFSK